MILSLLNATLRLHAATARALSPTSWVESSLASAGRHDRAAFLRFGTGRHPASLNFGDCFSYTLAQTLNAPLSFAGDDSSQTNNVHTALAIEQ